MQVIHMNHSLNSPPWRKGLRLISRFAQTVVAAFAIVGALHLAGVNSLAPSESTATATEHVVPASYGYFPDQFVNQASGIERPIEQF